MKPLACLTAFLTLLPMISAQNPSPASSPDKMGSLVLPWEKLVPNTPTKTGLRRQVFEAPTATLDKFHLHLSTLNPGENTGPLHRHPQEELVIVKEGTLEINIDGHKQIAGPGSAVFYAANENENMTNVGQTAATYYVIQFFTALTPKQ